jgi:hypothetical protein
MTAINFPDNPSVDDTYDVGDRRWRWDGSAWLSQTVLPVGPTGPEGPIGPTGPEGNFTVSDIAPTGPTEGDAWYNSETGQMFVRYDNFWVESNGAIVGPTGPAGANGTFIQASTTGPTVGDGDNGDLWIVYS